jgi:RNA-directed DNA polymerase
MDVGEMQKRLSQTAERDAEHVFDDLYSLLCNVVWLRVAHQHVNTNQGRETAGIDGESMSHFNGDLDGNLARLTTLLKTETFEPVPVRRTYIDKPNGGKRPLGIPTIRDRIVQEGLRMILEPIWEADFSVHSYGFRPNRSTYDAIAYIGNRLTGTGQSYQWVIEGDIKSYFDTIPHRKLIKAVNKRVADRKIRNLIWKFLRAGVMDRKEYKATLTGTPQGGIVSPLLANIYLHALDRYMESKYLHLSASARSKRRRQGEGNYLYLRYADDWVVLCNGTKADAQRMKEELGGLLDTMGLTLSEEKTKLTHITEGFTFLGYKIIREVGTSGKMAPKVLIPDKAMKQYRHKVRAALAPNTHKESVNAKITALNRLTNGWCQYYRTTSSPNAVFDRLRYELFWGMAHWLGRKWQKSMPEVMKQFREGNTFRTKSSTLIMPDEHKAKRLLTKTWHNPYTAKEAIIREKLLVLESLWSGYEPRHTRMDMREEVIARKGTICAMNGPDCESRGTSLHPSEVHVDHIKPRIRFKYSQDADRIENLQILCTNCHRAKTKNDLKVLSRVR